MPNGDPLPVVLLANKSDKIKVPLNEEVMAQYCTENGFIGWFATSAKDNVNIDEAVGFLVNHIVSRDEKTLALEAAAAAAKRQSSEGFTLGDANNNNNNSSSWSSGCKWAACGM